MRRRRWPFPSRTQGKWTQACRIAIGLAAVAHSAGDPVGVAVASEQGIAQLAAAHAARRDRRGRAPVRARSTPAGSGSLEPVLVARAPDAAHRAHLRLSLGDDDALLRAARERITAGADVLAIHIVAREELDPSRTAIIAQDPERTELKRSLVDETRAGYREAFGAWRAELARGVARGGRGVLRGADG